MKNFCKKNIGVIALVIAFIASFQMIAFPQKANAQIVTDLITELETGLTYIKSALSSVSTEITAVEQTAETLQDTVLDKIAVAIARQLLMQITDDVVSWIDSGFNGNPAFLQNPTAFFQNIGDQATAQFISSNGQLSSLCSPFSLQVRLAIAQQQQQNDGISAGYGTGASGGTGTSGNNLNQYSCTLSTIIQNTTNAVQGASINGFTGGDFNQGGWAAFAALVTQPQNTPNGAYLTAEDALQQKINNEVTQKQTELNQGGGFLSWETCTSDDSSDDSTGDDTSDDSGAAGDEDSPSDSSSQSNISADGTDLSQPPADAGIAVSSDDDSYHTADENDPTQTCSIQTPGSVISAALNKHLAVPTDELLLANSVDDVISDLFSSLITNTLQNGLASLASPSSGSGGSSYLQQLQTLQTSANPAFQSAQQTALQAVSGYINIETQVGQNYDSALALATEATTTLDQANSCYQNALASVTSATSTLNASTTAAATSYLQYQIGRVSEDEATITPVVATIFSQDQQANSNLSDYTNIQSEIQNAQNVNDLSQPQTELEGLVQSGPPVQTEVTQAQQDLTAYTAQLTPIQTDANNLLSECQNFVPTDSTTYNTQ